MDNNCYWNPAAGLPTKGCQCTTCIYRLWLCYHAWRWMPWLDGTTNFKRFAGLLFLPSHFEPFIIRKCSQEINIWVILHLSLEYTSWYASSELNPGRFWMLLLKTYKHYTINSRFTDLEAICTAESFRCLLDKGGVTLL